MSYRAVSNILAKSEPKGIPRLVLIVLAECANDSGICWPSMTTIAQRAALSVRHAKRVVHALGEAGHVAIERGNGMSHPNKYRLLDSDSPVTVSLLKVSESLRKFDLLVEQSRREAGELVPRKELESFISSFCFGARTQFHFLAENLATQLVGHQEAAICLALRESLTASLFNGVCDFIADCSDARLIETARKEIEVTYGCKRHAGDAGIERGVAHAKYLAARARQIADDADFNEVMTILDEVHEILDQYLEEDSPPAAYIRHEPDRIVLDDEKALYRELFVLLDVCMAMSRTLRAGRLRQLCVRHVICGDMGVDEIARRLAVTHRQVYRAIRQVRPHCLRFMA
jgi:Helix-turn-helix domain